MYNKRVRVNKRRRTTNAHPHDLVLGRNKHSCHRFHGLGEAVIRLSTKRHGICEFDTNAQGVSLLRQLQFHSPNLRIDGTKAQGKWTGFRIPLCEIDLSHAGAARLNIDDEAKAEMAVTTGYDGNGSPVE